MVVTGGPPGDISRLFGLERQRLLELLGSLEPADWARETPCPGWSILGLVTHLVNGDLGMLSRHRDDYLGAQPPADAGEAEFIAWIDDLMQDWVWAARVLSPRVALALLSWSGPQMVEYFAGEDVMARTAQVQWAGTDASPIWLNQLRELSEFWIHRQQLLEALGREPDLRADILEPVFEGLRWAYPFRLDGQVRSPGDTVTIGVTGPVSTQWHLVATEQGWDFADAPVRQVAALTMSSDEAWRLLTNNLSPQRQRALQTSGDPELLKVICQTRAILGRPK
jgi:uncharacterized protein (TIGR03083 family)